MSQDKILYEKVCGKDTKRHLFNNHWGPAQTTENPHGSPSETLPQILVSLHNVLTYALDSLEIGVYFLEITWIFISSIVYNKRAFVFWHASVHSVLQ